MTPDKKYQLTLNVQDCTLTFTGSLQYCKKVKLDLTVAMLKDKEEHYSINITEVNN